MIQRPSDVFERIMQIASQATYPYAPFRPAPARRAYRQAKELAEKKEFEDGIKRAKRGISKN